MVDPALAQLAESWLDELMQAIPLRSRPVIEWRGYRVSAGMAYFRARVIGLSRHVIRNAEQLHTTLVHEYAHLVAYERHGRAGAGHGPAWRQAMIELGAQPKRTHQYEVQRNQAKKEVGYQCLKCGAIIKRKRRLPKNRLYLHATCMGRLAFSYEISLDKESKATCG